MTSLCPICRKALPPPSERPFAPFCGERCKTIDLGNWIDERYRVGGEDAPLPDDEGYSDEHTS